MSRQGSRLPSKVENRAPTARDMTARGKREAKRSASPLVSDIKIIRALKGRNCLCVFRPFRPRCRVLLLTRGDALRACPWLTYLAPLARSEGVALALISCAVGAKRRRCPWLTYLAPLARSEGVAPGLHISRRWREAKALPWLSYSARLWRCESYVCDSWLRRDG